MDPGQSSCLRSIGDCSFCYFSTVRYCSLRLGQSDCSSEVAILSEPATSSLSLLPNWQESHHLRTPLQLHSQTWTEKEAILSIMIFTKRQPSPSSGDPSSEPPSALPSRLKTKQNVPSSWSPNTTASNRRRLGGLFADLGMPACGSPLKAAPARAESTPTKFGQKSGLMGTLSSPITSFADRLAVLSMIANGEIDSRESPVKRKGKSKQVEGDKECFADSEDAAYERKRDVEEGLKFEHLPDDLYVLLFTFRAISLSRSLMPTFSVSWKFFSAYHQHHKHFHQSLAYQNASITSPAHLYSGHEYSTVPVMHPSCPGRYWKGA